VILLDWDLPGCAAQQGLAQLQAVHPSGHVILLGAYKEPEMGSAAFISRLEPQERLVEVVRLNKILHVILIVLTLLLAVTAIPGGAMLLANIYSPPVDQLQGSIFKDFTIPGLALALIVGGSALVSAVLLLKKSKFGSMSAATVGVITFLLFSPVVFVPTLLKALFSPDQLDEMGVNLDE
jgi:hypothetical protein